jgi:succinoglycan biosynthesis transport protein ExoP
MNMPIDRDFRGAATPLQPEIETLDLVRYWRAVNRNKWRILLLVAVVALLGTMYANSLRPIYRASATVLVEASKQKALSQEEVFSAVMGATTRDYFLTQFEIMRSREYVEKLVRVMNLTTHPEFDPRQQKAPWYAAWMPGNLFAKKSEPAATPSEIDIEEAVVGRVMSQISLQPMRNTQLVKLSFDSHNQEIAGNVPNTLAMIYIVNDLQARGEISRQALSFLTAHSEELKKKVRDSEQALQSYREREKIIDAKNVSLSGAGRQLDDLTTSLLEARRKRAEMEAMYNQVTAAKQGRADLENLPLISKHAGVLRVKDIEAEAERKLADAAKRYGAEHPRLIGAQSELKTAQENVRRQIANVIQAASKEYEVARANEEAIERALGRAKGDVQSFNRKEFELSRLERELTANRQMYEMFIQRTKETRIGDIQTPVARIIDPSRAPKGPVGPNKRLIIILSVLGALLAGIGLALLIERLNNTVKATHEVESKLGVKSVGVVQFTAPLPGVPIERMFQHDSQNAFSEAIRTIRSDVLLSGIDAPQKTLLLTSAVPNEGKTTVSCNLAYALSEVTSTLLLEADMRRPKIGRVLGDKPGRPGLSELVAGTSSMDDCIYQAADSNLHILQAGDVPSNPLELLSSKRFKEILEKLKKTYDVIVIDSAPVQLVSDAVVLAQFATSVLLVVKADDTPYPVVRHSVSRLLRADAPLLGAVLNQINIEKADKFYGEYSGYGNTYYSKYGYFNGEPSKSTGKSRGEAKSVVST